MGKGSFDINFPPNTAEICATPGGAAVFGGSATPIALTPADRTRANTVYNHWGESLDRTAPLIIAFLSSLLQTARAFSFLPGLPIQIALATTASKKMISRLFFHVC
jgi:hypothetical protein